MAGSNKLIKQRDELIELSKMLIEAFEKLARDVNDTTELERIEEFQEHLDLLVDFDERAFSDY